MTLDFIEPEGWERPRGYSNGVLAPAGSRMLHVAGQIGWDADQTLVGPGFVAQFRQALSNVMAVVQAAGASASDICSLTIFVTDKQQYLGALPAVGAAYREILGKHFPAMALVQVADLLEPGAMVEIQAQAALPERG